MDILNWLYLVKNKFTRTTIENPATDLVVLGADVSYAKRGDKYQNYTMTAGDFSNSVKGYKSYMAVISQSGTDDPVEEAVLENTLGATMTYTYVSPGVYSISSDVPVFPGPTDSYIVVHNSATVDGGDYYDSQAAPVFFNVAFLSSTLNGGVADGVIGANSPTIIEIRLYEQYY